MYEFNQFNFNKTKESIQLHHKFHYLLIAK